MFSIGHAKISSFRTPFQKQINPNCLIKAPSLFSLMSVNIKCSSTSPLHVDIEHMSGQMMTALWMDSGENRVDCPARSDKIARSSDGWLKK